MDHKQQLLDEEDDQFFYEDVEPLYKAPEDPPAEEEKQPKAHLRRNRFSGNKLYKLNLPEDDDYGEFENEDELPPMNEVSPNVRQQTHGHEDDDSFFYQQPAPADKWANFNQGEISQGQKYRQMRRLIHQESGHISRHSKSDFTNDHEGAPRILKKQFEKLRANSSLVGQFIPEEVTASHRKMTVEIPVNEVVTNEFHHVDGTMSGTVREEHYLLDAAEAPALPKENRLKKQTSMIQKVGNFFSLKGSSHDDDFQRIDDEAIVGKHASNHTGYKSHQRRKKFQKSRVASYISSGVSSVVTKVTNVVNIQPGSLSGSIFSLIAACMGAGTLTMPYIVSKTGVVMGPVLILLGALASYYAGMLIIKCSEMTGKQTYEEFAYIAFGRTFSRVVSICVLISLLGFATSYVALAKTLIPTALESTLGKDVLPYQFQNNPKGQFIDVTIFTFMMFLPMSLPMNLSALRFSSALGVLCTIILMFVIVYQFFTNKTLVPCPEENIHNASLYSLKAESIIEAVPYITFLYLFQPNVPQTYFELKPQENPQSGTLAEGEKADDFMAKLPMMDKVLYRSSMGAVLVYIIVGCFGYFTFSNTGEQTFNQLQSLDRHKDILEADYGAHAGFSIQVSQLFILFAVICASPLAILPAKKSYHELTKRDDEGPEPSQMKNIIVTVTMIVGCYLLAVSIHDIGSVISIAGATVNPFIGFLFPIIFYLKIERDHHLEQVRVQVKKRSATDKIVTDEWNWSRGKDQVLAVFVGIVILVIGAAGFLDLFN